MSLLLIWWQDQKLAKGFSRFPEKSKQVQGSFSITTIGGSRKTKSFQLVIRIALPDPHANLVRVAEVGVHGAVAHKVVCLVAVVDHFLKDKSDFPFVVVVLDE